MSFMLGSNVMFRHMKVSRDTLVLQHIIIVCFESAENY